MAVLAMAIPSARWVETGTVTGPDGAPVAGRYLLLPDTGTACVELPSRPDFRFATSIGFEIERVHTLPQGRSDHLPILVTARVAARRAAA